MKNINLSRNGNVYLETYSGVLIKLMGTNDIEGKLQLALSVFVNDTSTRYNGQITAYNDKENGKIAASYEINADY